MIRMRRMAAALALAIAATACSDSTSLPPLEGVPIQLAVSGPQLASPAETAALAAAFDRVDSYEYQVVDSATFETIASGAITVQQGSSVHALDINVPEGAVGRSVQITLVAFDGAMELYRSVLFTTLSADVGSIRLDAEIRYTGPGIRGTVRAESGAPLGGVTVALNQGQVPIGTAVTEADGTYLFVGVAAGTYQVQPTPPSGSQICPIFREVSLATTDDVLVTDFRSQTSACGTRVLVMSGGDFDETAQVASFLNGDPDLTADTTFFFVNQLPALSFVQQFDVVLLFMNGIFDQSTALGNRLVEYVDLGGNLVVASFYFQGRSDSGLGSVGWGALEAIDPFTAGPGGATYQPVALGTVIDPTHPIIQGVSTLTSASYSSGVVAKSSGTTVIATWDDGAPLVGFSRGAAGQRIVGVSLFPAATQTVTGDAQTLWINAVRWAGEIGGPS